MKLFWELVLLASAVTVMTGLKASAAESRDGKTPAVASGYTDMRIGLILQTGYEFLPDQVKNRRNSFEVQRARLSIDGHLLSEDFTYLFVADAVGGFDIPAETGAPGSEIFGSDGEGDVPFLLDARLGWSLPGTGISFWIGRFVPSWGLLMPEKPSRLGAIAYPLYLHGGENAIGRFRNAGAQAQIDLTGFLQLGGGVFNGGVNTWRDDNDSKDLLVFATVKPISGLVVRASSFFSFPQVKDGIDENQGSINNGRETHFSPVLEARFLEYGFDLMIGAAADIALRHEDDIRKDYQAYGFMGHVGFLVIGDWLELMGRAEWWEPNSQTNRNAQLRISAGPQLLVESIHLQIYVNYIHDDYESSASMCRNYLNLSNCDIDAPTQAKNNANSLLIQFTLDM
jgi:hypothetical protein